jgi:hypothetical protein
METEDFWFCVLKTEADTKILVENKILHLTCSIKNYRELVSTMPVNLCLKNIYKPVIIFISFLILSPEIFAQVNVRGKLWHNEERTLRYKPEGGDFVITNGNRLFTRALYGTHTAFRVESGDRPEFALYMPGMGGNFKIGIGSGNHSKWITSATNITARYRPGAMIYTIKDSLLGKGSLDIEILAMADAEGFIIREKANGILQPLEVYFLFGGANGKKFSRDGDMGPDPESVFYLTPGNCTDNRYEISSSGFILHYGSGIPVSSNGTTANDSSTQKQTKEHRLAGIFPTRCDIKTGDATKISSPLEVFQSVGEKSPVVTGKIVIADNRENYLAVYNPETSTVLKYNELRKIFNDAENARSILANRIKIHTPDPYLNTIGGALGIAADAIWESPSWLHGAVGWRMRLNGWRGPYAGDALGWHDRARSHFDAYALSQFTSPAFGPVVPDSTTHLARSTEKPGIGMFTSGYISRDPGGTSFKAHHYDMNLVYIDQLQRHFEWTGDTGYMKKLWPVIKRHLNWETRNFDPDGNGLYDAYAAIWASDALQYSGGDVTHSSAYNYLAFKKAAEIAAVAGEDPAPYKTQAAKILEAMNKILWMPAQGCYAEYKDRLGNQLLHPSAALWTIYHIIDSEVPDNFQAWECLRYIDKNIPHIPIQAKGLDNNGYYTLSTTNWMPYEWSLNNVVLAESMHTALAEWQGGRNEEAFKLFKSEVLASMYLGGSPGNFVQISHYDANRGEAYRDFGDPIGIFSRALVEGLFGIKPDALKKTLTIRPGLPSEWNYASFSTPDISFDFKRNGKVDHYILQPFFSTALHLKFDVIAPAEVKQITVNGKNVSWKNMEDAVGKPVIEITAAPESKYNITIEWKEKKTATAPPERTCVSGSLFSIHLPDAKPIQVFDPQHAFSSAKISAGSMNAVVSEKTGNYTAFLQVKQGSLSWWLPVVFSVEKEIILITPDDAEQNVQKFRLQNNGTEKIRALVVINDFKTSVDIDAGKTSAEINIPETNLVAGTNTVTISYHGKVISTTITNWNGTKKLNLHTINISEAFNDKVTHIFRNKYLSPRPPVTTLQLPWQGIGDWPHPLAEFEVNDSGLRKMAGKENIITLPQGIIFNTPGDPHSNNILFTSQWENYPSGKTIRLAGKASHAWFLMAGSTNPMQSQMENGEIIITYDDESSDTLSLRNPDTWWPVDQDYYTDGFAFALKAPRAPRIHLKTGRIVNGMESKDKFNGKTIPGGAAIVLDMPLNQSKKLKSLTLLTISNDVVIGLMAVTLGE